MFVDPGAVPNLERSCPDTDFNSQSTRSMSELAHTVWEFCGVWSDIFAPRI
jgi:hypothetical protein